MKLFNRKYKELAEESALLHKYVKSLNRDMYGKTGIAYVVDIGLKERTRTLESQIASVEKNIQGVMKALLSLGVVAEQEKPAEADFFFYKTPMVIVGEKAKK